MSAFDEVIEKLLKLEGGYVNHKADRGGPTNWGITQATLAIWRKTQVSAQDVKELSSGEARAIYKARYWDPLKLDEVESLVLADLMFDQSVNRGPKKAAENMQSAFNRAYPKNKLVVDGNIGPKTLFAFNSSNEFKIAFSYLQIMQMDYVNICVKNPSQLVFLRGWTNRVHSNMDSVLKRVWEIL